MESLKGWVDEKKVHRLANQLLGSEAISEEEVESIRSEQQEHRVEAKEASVPSRVSSLLAQTKARVEQQGLLAHTPEGKASQEAVKLKQRVPTQRIPTKSSDFSVDTLGLLQTKLKGFEGVEGVCLVDDQGDVLLDGMDNAAWTHLVVTQIKHQGGVNILKEKQPLTCTRVAGEQYIYSMILESDYGALALGVFLRGRLSEDLATQCVAEAQGLVLS